MEELALKRFSEDTIRFANLMSDSLHIDSLSPEESEIFWALIDYSSMSDAAHVAQSQSPDPNFWVDTDDSWHDLFGGFDSTNFGPRAMQSEMSSVAFGQLEPSQPAYSL